MGIELVIKGVHFNMNSSDVFQFSTEIKNEDFIVRDHLVHGVRIMPGVTFLDIIIRGLQAKGKDIENIQFNHIVFFEPISTSDDYDQRIQISVEHSSPSGGSIEAYSQKVKNGQVVEKKWHKNLQAQFSYDEGGEEKPLQITQLKKEFSGSLDINEAYSYIRKIAIHHGEFMKGLGTVHYNEHAALAELFLSQIAKEHAEDFYLHPVYLDASTLVPGIFQLIKEQENGGKVESDLKPSIPISIKAFRVLRALDHVCYVHVQKDKIYDAPSGEVRYVDIMLYNAAGSLSVIIEGLAIKKIRTRESIANLVSSTPLRLEQESMSHSTEGMKVETYGTKNTDAPIFESIEEEVIKSIAEINAEFLEHMDVDKKFYEMGLDSTHLLELVHKIEQKLDCELYPTLLFEYTTVKELVSYLEKNVLKSPRDMDFPRKMGSTKVNVDLASTGEESELEHNVQYLYPQWVASNKLEVRRKKIETLILFCEDDTFYHALKKKRSLKETNLILVLPGEKYQRLSEGIYEIAPTVKADYERLFSDLQLSEEALVHLVHMWSKNTFNIVDLSSVSQQVGVSFYSLLYIYQALVKLRLNIKTELLYLYFCVSVQEKYISQPIYSAVRAMAKTLHQENPTLRMKTLELQLKGKEEDINQAVDIVISELFTDFTLDADVRIYEQQRWVLKICHYAPTVQEKIYQLRKEGVYLVTGGLGKLALAFTKHLAEQGKGNFILIGRSELDQKGISLIKDYAPAGINVIYRQADVSDYAEMQQVLREIKDQHGAVNGIIHTAGVTRDAYGVQKTFEHAEEVFAPKLSGAIILDQLTKDEHLDFFIMFSSTAALMGNAGQCDYAYANHFMDHFAQWRREQDRPGVSASINWPLWQEGGMQMENSLISKLEESTGLVPLATQTGFNVFNTVLIEQIPSLSVVEGKTSQFLALLRKQGVLFEGMEKTYSSVALNNPSSYFSTQADEPVIEVGEDDIAIIGLSGRYPQAENIEEFWANLQGGKDCITEIPVERWDYTSYYSEQKKLGFSYAKWGGFMDDIDKFDPLFFNISPKEAEFMDPQERLFLQTVWHTIEDAGYTRETLNSTNVGVYVGVMWGQYQLLETEAEDGQKIAPISFYGAIANRVSYFFNFEGPSMAIDTMCSSSLTAIHLACESIKKGECELALAGGVNVAVHPNKFKFLSQSEMASRDGRCKTFGAGGDGYVPGEGVGAILLKPLKKAIQDKDNIYAIIKGTAINAGGKTSGFTVPNPNSQSKVIELALSNAGVDPRSISYVEAHGTGTSLGDPIEIQGLTNAYKKYTTNQQYCAIGSAKSNIGHLESAAGIAGITKTVLQLKYKRLVPSLHSDEINPNIQFEHTPFYVQRELQEWKPSVVMRDQEKVILPRRAAISSFGAGGANAHIILEEYKDIFISQEENGVSLNQKYLCFFSQKTEERLRTYVQTFIEFLKIKPVNLKDVSFTLHQGREEFDYRLAVVATDIPDLLEKLSKFINEQANEQLLIFSGNRKEGKNRKTLIEAYTPVDRAAQLAQAWVQGQEIDISEISDLTTAKRISLPTYVFAKERYWVPQPVQGEKRNNAIHPLIDQNESTLEYQVFTKQLTGNEFFLTDHRFNGNALLPGVAYLEMARVAGELSIPKQEVVKLLNIRWIRPLYVSEPCSLQIELYPEDAGIYFEISTTVSADEKVVYALGELELTRPDVPLYDQTRYDIDELKSRLTTSLQKDEYYKGFQEINFQYGKSLQTIRQIYFNEREALAQLVLPNEQVAAFSDYKLHPSILDGAFQTVACLLNHENEQQATYLPYSIQEVNLFKPLPALAFAYVTASQTQLDEGKAYDIFILDEEGHILIEIQELLFQVSYMSSRNNHVEESLSHKLLNEQEEGKAEQVTKRLVVKMEEWLKRIVSQHLKLAIEIIEANEPMETYGIDSIAIMDMTRELEQYYGTLSKTLFYEYKTISELAAYFVANHRDKLHFKDEQLNQPVRAEKEKEQFESLGAQNRIPKRSMMRNKKKINQITATEDIAIVGIDGRYPEATNLIEFWDNLKQGKDCITEIPKERWEYQEFINEHKLKHGKTDGQWGGHLKDVDKFDALFFNMSPIEAQITDPQERLFLECAWKTIEDAGYNKKRLSDYKVGVFVGVMYGQYQFFGVEETMKGKAMALESSFASIANRVSYFFNFSGPSLSVDTMCSSSLTSIHLACESIKRGEIDMALAGGVNLSLHSNKYILLSQGNFLSSDGKCRSFGAGGDGYVPGEGVGAVLLKPLSKAIEDRDHIYAVIKGSSLNHGGKTNGYTVPNPHAQAEVVLETLQKSKVDPRTISYIEAHGTGTSLGDPIEITGLTKAFRHQMPQVCSIGSVKSNIGHLESAAGIAGLTKVLLQMKHKQLVPSLHSTRLNEHIDFDQIPFKVQQELSHWEKPIIEQHGNQKTYPRRAGISSFGAGGANAHLIVEEYEQEENRLKPQYFREQILVLSAKNEERLKAVAAQLEAYIQNAKQQNFENKTERDFLTRLAYTLQVGREPLDTRLAIVIQSVEDLLQALAAYRTDALNRLHHIEVYSGKIKDGAASQVFIDGEEGEAFVQSIIKQLKLSKLARLWSVGVEIDWELLYQNGRPIPLSLPTYPFEKESYWVPIEAGSEGEQRTTVKLHPLIHSNISTLRQQKYKVSFTGTESIILDHLIGGRKVLPGAAIIEMVRAAGELALESQAFQIKSISWLRPVILEDKSLELHIVLTPELEEVHVKIHDASNEEQVYSASILQLIGAPMDQPMIQVDLSEIEQRATWSKKREEFYLALRQQGLQYGQSLQSVVSLQGNQKEVLSKLHFSAQKEDIPNRMQWIPAIIDGAFQTISSLLEQKRVGHTAYVPFEVRDMIQFLPVEQVYYAYVTRENSNLESQEESFSIQFLNKAGQVVLIFKTLTLKAIQQPSVQVEQGEAITVNEKNSPLYQLLQLVVDGKLKASEAEKLLEANKYGTA